MAKNKENPFSAPEQNYQLLTAEKQTVRGKARSWETDHVLSKYLAYTDDLVGTLDGSIAERDLVDPDNPELSHQRPDIVIWLDKSARPVSWFVQALWEQLARPDADLPQFEYLNIDRTEWFKRQGFRHDESERRLGPEDFSIDEVPDEDIARIRAIFTIGEIDRDNWQESVKELPTTLDNKNILIVDEVKNKGGTLSIAQQLIKKAFPTATVSGEYFWQAGRYALNGNPSELQMDSAPVWYDAGSAFGRGIGDISQEYFEQLPDTHENYKKKLGWTVLSAPHVESGSFKPVADKAAMKLQQDIAYLSYDVSSGNVLRVPSPDREYEDFLRILSEQDLDLASFKKLREERDARNKQK